MTSNGFAPHELLELHELLAPEIVGAQKLQASITMVQDQTLKGVMQNCLAAKQRRIARMQQMLSANGVQ